MTPHYLDNKDTAQNPQKGTKGKWALYTDGDGHEHTVRLGFWGHEYDLLHNMCCYFSDHLIKILIDVRVYPGYNREDNKVEYNDDSVAKHLKHGDDGIPDWVFRCGCFMLGPPFGPKHVSVATG